MNCPDEIQLDLDNGIDRKLLATLRERYLQINAGRLQRAMTGLSTRQQQVLAVLPVLFHVNHPSLPGYVTSTTPAGICDFEPNADQVFEAQRLARAFNYKVRDHASTRPIDGLFLIGSLGTLAQAEDSDIDVWVCHACNLGREALEALQRKCQLLETWARSQGADTHIFLIDTQAFAHGQRTGQLGTDDCGTTQHYLLLDEFYRTTLWLAGRTPLWWLVPPGQESDYPAYTQTLLAKRFVRPQEALDLGHLAQIPGNEFIGAGLWQLFKGIDAPHKSLLKLLLAEAYASQYPAVRCLSLDYKQAVFANQLDLDLLDPYVMVYRRIERYLLQRHEHARLELVRRSLYLKVNARLSEQGRTEGWQRRLLRRLTGEWGWGDTQLAMLDGRPSWRVHQVTLERRELVAELSRSYRFLVQFARAHGATSRADQRELNLLGRRLHAAFERRADKVEILQGGRTSDLAEQTVTLAQSPSRRAPGSHHWELYSGNLNSHEMELANPIKRCWQLVELLLWAHCNGVIGRHTRLALHPGISALSEPELLGLLGSLQQLIALPLPAVSEVRLLQPSVADEVLLLVNVGIDPLPHHRELDILLTTERTDSLNYGGLRENLVLTVDQVTINTWNEVLVHRYDGEHALMRCLRDFINLPKQAGGWPSVRVHCFAQHRAQAISQRVAELFQTAKRLHAQGTPGRYLLQMAQQVHVLEWGSGQATLTSLNDHDALLSFLGQARRTYSPLHLDANALQDTDVRLVLEQERCDCIQVFYRLQDSWTDLYVLDECNALWHERLPLQDEAHLLLPLQRFLASVLRRRDAQLPYAERQAARMEITYAQLLASGPGKPRSLEQRPVPDSGNEQRYYDVQAMIQAETEGATHVTLFCDQQEFSELDHGSRLYAVVAREIIRQRRHAGQYRCYITDLDVTGLLDGHLATTQVYLDYKRALEQALNEGLQQVVAGQA
nr:class I adenylate cyclase [uncultured Pseudomonas sp.]